MAAEVILKGAGAKFNPHKTMREIWNEVKRSPLRHDHTRALELVRELTEDAVLLCRRRGPLGPVARVLLPVLLAADLASREFCWTPGDVKTLAEGLARH
jgi:hypothetical protein